MKFVVVLNKKIEQGKIMNALAHLVLGFASENKDLDMGVINYEDKSGGAHYASKWPFIVLKADNSNKIRTFRNALIEKGLPFASFTESMTQGTFIEQLEKSKSIEESELEYYGVCTMSSDEELRELTRKFSLWV